MKKKKWGKIGAPSSAKRRAHMRKIAKKRRGFIGNAMMWLLIILVIILGIVLNLTGCNADQVQQLQDGAAATAPVVQDIAAGGTAFVASPAGVIIPQPYKEIAGLLFLGLSGVGNILQSIGRRRVDKTLSVVTQAVEKSPGAEEVKVNVADGLKTAGIYKQGKAIIAGAKSGV